MPGIHAVLRHSRVLTLVAVLATVALTIPACVVPSAAPAYQGDFPDPYVLHVGRTYYAFATGDAQVHLRVMQSKDLINWTANGDPYPMTDPHRKLPEALRGLPGWAAPVYQQTWAPAVLQLRPHRFLMYYTTQDKTSGQHCLSVATATTPAGPYQDGSAAPLVCRDGGSIDPNPFLDTTTGKLYLLWKGEPTTAGGPSTLWSQQLSANGRTLVGSRRALLSATQPWQHNLIEGPSMIRSGRTLFLFYSANAFDEPTAAIGYATCASPLPRYGCDNKTPNGPWLSSNSRVKGPSGPDAFAASGGTGKLAYHAWWPKAGKPFPGYNTGALRALWIDNLTFQAGKPSLN